MRSASEHPPSPQKKPKYNLDYAKKTVCQSFSFFTSISKTVFMEIT